MPDQSIPAPHPSFRGSAQKNPGNLDEMAAKWAIPGMLMEPTATVSLYAGRLMDRDGRAYSADELPGGTPTAASIVSAMESATEEQKQALLPETIEVDYIETADQSGFEIPAGAYSQKGGVPYFGNAPIVAGGGQTRNFFRGIIDSNWATTPLATFSLPAGITGNASKFCRLDLDLSVLNSSALPAGVNNFDVAVALLFQNEFNSIVATRLGVFILDLGGSIGPDNRTLVSAKGSFLFGNELSGQFNPSAENAIKYSKSPNSSPGVANIIESDADYYAGQGAGPAVIGAAETLRLMIVPQPTYTNMAVRVSGTATFYSDYQPNS